MKKGTWRRLATVGTMMMTASLLTACGSSGQSASPTLLNFYGNPDNSGATQAVVDRCNQEAKGAYTILYQLLPSSSDGQKQSLVRRLAAGSPEVDIMAMDVNWTAEFAQQHWVEPVPQDQVAAATDGVLDAAAETARDGGTLYAIPFNTNTQLLWYRKDLVSTPPTTWDQLIKQATALATAGKPHLVEVQGAKYEGLSVWFNSLVNSAGGTVLSADNARSTINQSSVLAATVMRNLATSVAADPNLAQTQEEQARLAFESGTAAFQVNYPFVYASAQREVPDLAKNMAWAPWPRVTADQPARVTVGGINLGVSAFSQHKDQARNAITCLRSEENQKVLATKAGLPPVLTKLYDDPDVREAYPMADAIRAGLQTGVTRPQTPKYQAVSSALQEVLSPPSAIDPLLVSSKLQTAIDQALAASS